MRMIKWLVAVSLLHTGCTENRLDDVVNVAREEKPIAFTLDYGKVGALDAEILQWQRSSQEEGDVAEAWVRLGKAPETVYVVRAYSRVDAKRSEEPVVYKVEIENERSGSRHVATLDGEDLAMVWTRPHSTRDAAESYDRGLELAPVEHLDGAYRDYPLQTLGLGVLRTLGDKELGASTSVLFDRTERMALMLVEHPIDATDTTNEPGALLADATGQGKDGGGETGGEKKNKKDPDYPNVEDLLADKCDKIIPPVTLQPFTVKGDAGGPMTASLTFGEMQIGAMGEGRAVLGSYSRQGNIAITSSSCSASLNAPATAMSSTAAADSMEQIWCKGGKCCPDGNTDHAAGVKIGVSVMGKQVLEVAAKLDSADAIQGRMDISGEGSSCYEMDGDSKGKIYWKGHSYEATSQLN